MRNSRLMGSGTASSRAAAVSTEGLSKKEVVARAAERRLSDMQWCGECIEVDEDSGGEVEVVEKKKEARTVVDLTEDTDDDASPAKPVHRPKKRSAAAGTSSKKTAKPRPPPSATTSSSSSSEPKPKPKSPPPPWSCSSCTLVNPGTALACGACGTPVVSDEVSITLAARAQEKVTAAELRGEEAKRKKEEEREESLRQFGGFDIYGKQRNGTGSMGHIT